MTHRAGPPRETRTVGLERVAHLGKAHLVVELGREHERRARRRLEEAARVVQVVRARRARALRRAYVRGHGGGGCGAGGGAAGALAGLWVDERRCSFKLEGWPRGGGGGGGGGGYQVDGALVIMRAGGPLEPIGSATLPLFQSTVAPCPPGQGSLPANCNIQGNQAAMLELFLCRVMPSLVTRIATSALLSRAFSLPAPSIPRSPVLIAEEA